ncbi:MAG: signal recognition particle protein, partial [Bacteroidia bacterium]
ESPKIIDGSRRRRIAKGAGVDVKDVNQLLKQFNETGKMMRMMNQGGGRQMMSMMNQLRRM